MYQKMKAQSSEKRRTGDTGIPAGTQRRFEERYGVSFADVHVHYNSPEPARLGALAFARGTQVYLGPGQERHLNHELGHVIQQKRGLVPATIRVGGYPVNDDTRLEREADAIAAFRGPAVWEERGQEGAAQLTQATITYTSGDNKTVVAGPDVTQGKGDPGVSHAEQLAWQEAEKRGVYSKLRAGNDVEIVFSIDEPVCDACRNWFDATLYPALSDISQSFSLFVTVKNSASVKVLGTGTVWTNEAAYSPTWERLSPYDRFVKFMDERREEDGRLGARMDPASTLDAYDLISTYIGESTHFREKFLDLLDEAKKNVLKLPNTKYYPEIARERVSEMTPYRLLQELRGITYENGPLQDALIEFVENHEGALRECLQDHLLMYLEYNYEMKYESDGESPPNPHF